jgi:hypothetical protein
MPLRANLLDLPPARFPKMGRTGGFSAVRIGKGGRGARFCQKSARAKTETAILQAKVLGLLGLIAASLVLPDIGSPSPIAPHATGASLKRRISNWFRIIDRVAGSSPAGCN